VLIENLRRTAERPGDEPELTLFETFDGLDEFDQVDFYKHEANWSNRMILGDSLQVMTSLTDREQLRRKVQMIYIDPPYGIKFGSNWQVSARNRDVKDGKLEDAAREAEQIKAFRDTWELGIHSYLTYLRDRLMVARDLLTDSGSCFVQIGDQNVHLVRALMDEVFGSHNFVSLITVRKTHTAGSPSGGTDVLASVSDYLVWYAVKLENVKYRQLYEYRGGYDWVNYDYVLTPSDTTRRITKEEKLGLADLAAGERVYRRSPLTSASSPPSARFEVDHNGKNYLPGKGGWKTNAAGMAKLSAAGRLEAYGTTLAFRRFTDDFPYFPRTNLWTDTARGGYGEEQVYVVQTGTKVIERCIVMCTDPGDLVLDPTCGSGTTAYVGEQWGRRWITGDTSRVAITIARQRIMGSKFPWYLLADSVEGRLKEETLSAMTLPRQEVTNDVRHGFVCERAQHITLKSIANNPDIQTGITSELVDAVIRRHADFELLYDRPYQDDKKVRVAGPFTVESLSPHRSLTFAGGENRANQESRGETEAATDADAPNFERSILDNLAKAGIQNGRRNERIAFASFDTYAGMYIQGIGDRATPTTDDVAEKESQSDPPTRIAIAIGPQYGTVSASFVKSAAREALDAEGVDLLCVLGFAFDPLVTGVTEDDGLTVEASDAGFASVEGTRKLGRLPVLMVRMNADLLMGEELKKTGAGNLFTVFGEPDISIDETAEGCVVSLKGIDVYDPTTGEVRSNDTGQIALWMIDTNYNEESFFVRHCYFTGGSDPYRRLKTALSAEIDADAWASLNSAVSRPFAKPDSGKIAVKVINDYGDEVMKVFEL
jgi:adenine-specific DNA-methyltransferase